MSNLLQELRSNIRDGLSRMAVTTCSRWANKYRFIVDQTTHAVRNIDYSQHPWTMAMRDCNRSWVGPKAAQMGYTEVCLDRAFFTIDIKKQSVLYLLPKKTPDATDFSASRFDPALEMSDHLRSIFHSVSNVGHKRAGAASLFVRGTMSKSAVKSVPVSTVIFDEKDEMNQKNIAQAVERMSGQDFKQAIEVSTPTIEDYGISKTFKQTNQQHFFFTCPHCGQKTELLYPECLVITADDVNDKSLADSHIICLQCKHKLEHKTKSEWLTKAMFNRRAGWEMTTNADSQLDGFYINQLYSFKVTPVEFARHAILARYDQAMNQELWNSKAGLPHVEDGARVTEAMIESVLGGHTLKSPRPSGVMVTMGVDVGKWLYYHIDAWYFPREPGPSINTYAQKYTVQVGRVADFEQLDTLMKQWQPQHCVVDANPERRKASEFADRFYGHVHLCFYPRGLSSSSEVRVNSDQRTVSVDRTSWLDLTLGRFHRKDRAIILPRDIDQEYREHMKALVRKPGLDSDGNPNVKYINTDPDHYAHASNYSEIALPLAMSISTASNIAAFL